MVLNLFVSFRQTLTFQRIDGKKARFAAAGLNLLDADSATFCVAAQHRHTSAGFCQTFSHSAANTPVAPMTTATSSVKSNKFMAWKFPTV